MCIMSSTLMDLLFDKLSPFSSKMKGESLKLSGSSYLMSGSSSSTSHQTLSVDFFNGVLRETFMNSETSNQVIPLKQPLGLTGNNSCSFLNAGKAFSYPLSSFLMDTYRYSHSASESHFLSNKLINHFVNSVFDKSSEINPSAKSSFVLKKASVPPVSEVNMAVSETAPSLTKRSEVTNKCTVPNTSMLNKELAIRKTKEIQKRSKKRRRRQKKNQLLECSSSTSVSDDEVDGVASSLTSCVCLVTDNTEFGCTVAVRHSLQVTPNILSSFAVSVDSASDDDTDWEAFEAEQCSSNSVLNKIVDSKIQSSNLTTSQSQDFKCSKPVDCNRQKVTSFLSSFMVPVESCSDDESDWDSCETEIINGTPEFEFAGLLLTSLCTPQTLSFDTNCGINKYGEDDETVKLRIHLEEVNKNWNKATQGIEVKPKLPSKVSFATDEALVEIFPVDIWERKGEWEIYATERLRFKRKIDELEKILSPCFNPEHRSKVFKKLHEPTL